MKSAHLLAIVPAAILFWLVPPASAQGAPAFNSTAASTPAAETATGRIAGMV